jgi:hypothetical protein
MSWCATVPVLQAKVAAPVAEGYINVQMLYQKYRRFLAQAGLTTAVQDTWPTVNIAASFVEKLLQRFVLGCLKADWGTVSYRCAELSTLSNCLNAAGPMQHAQQPAPQLQALR